MSKIVGSWFLYAIGIAILLNVSPDRNFPVFVMGLVASIGASVLLLYGLRQFFLGEIVSLLKKLTDEKK